MKDYLLEKYPDHRAVIASSKVEYIYSPLIVPVKRKAFEQVCLFIREAFLLSRQESYQNQISTLGLKIAPSPQASVLMSYDFHIDSEGNPKLIEINTNSSGFLIGSELYDFYQSREFPDRKVRLKKSFQDEANCFSSPIKKAIILDENPPSQKMYLEFLLYQDFFNRELGWDTQILDVNDLNRTHKGRFIYNRTTDFYLQNQCNRQLREFFEERTALVSPNPNEYRLLADKQRLLDWGRREFWSAVKDQPSAQFHQRLLPSYRLTSALTEFDVWKERKKYFFKPLRMYGSKKTYRGSSISRSKFNELLQDPDMMIQAICPPSETTDQEGKSWRYDLRFFVYRDEVQFAIARLYQGLLTNFKTIGGGFARIQLV